MNKYKVRWNYKSSLGGPWIKGSVIELDEELARRVNLDSPDVLMPVPEAPERKNRLGSAESVREEVDPSTSSGQASEALVNEEKDPLPASPLKGGGEDEENEPDPALRQAQGSAEDAITEEDFKAVKLPEDPSTSCKTTQDKRSGTSKKDK